MLCDLFLIMRKFIISFVSALIVFLILSASIIFLPTVEFDKNNQADFSNMRYLAFGDSITQGDGLVSSKDSYPCVVSDILGCEVVNKGISGSTLGYTSERHCIADTVIDVCSNDKDFQIISVMGGTNDVWWNIPLGTIKDNSHDTIYGSLNLIASYLKTNYKDAFIFFMTPLQNNHTDYVNDAGYTLRDIANAVRLVGNKYNIPVLDMFNEGRFEEVESGMYNPDCDGTHPLKEYVHDYMSPQIAQFIKDNYKK